MTIEELDIQIAELQHQRRELEKEEREAFLKSAQDNVGRCFIINDTTYVKVIDVPQVKQTMTSTEFNRYQYPAIYITTEEIPFEIDALFSGAWDEGYVYPKTRFKEITQEEFNTRFDEAIKEFSNRIKGAKNE